MRSNTGDIWRLFR